MEPRHRRDYRWSRLRDRDRRIAVAIGLERAADRETLFRILLDECRDGFAADDLRGDTCTGRSDDPGFDADARGVHVSHDRAEAFRTGQRVSASV